ncbi:thioredoxin family protein [Puia sp.]|jgi:thioredoxin-related protein|uniref:thioredoxin family protein n=1 Tax=Puia sp. TaxID=2045100 RepID=UPI002F3E395B
MKKLFFMGALLPALLLLSFYPDRLAADSLPIGAPLPKGEVVVKDVSGRNISLAQTKKANGLLVMFSCNTCPYVIRNQQRTKEVCAYAGGRQIGVVLLNSNEGDRNGGNSFEEMQAYAKDQGYGWYYALDDKNVLADAFGASRTPECYLFDKNGILVYHGAIDDSPGDQNQVKRHHLQAAIDELVAGKAVTIKETRSVGCSINRGS